MISLCNLRDTGTWYGYIGEVGFSLEAVEAIGRYLVVYHSISFLLGQYNPRPRYPWLWGYLPIIYLSTYRGIRFTG